MFIFGRVAVVVQKYSDREKVLDQIHMRLWVQILLDFELLSLLLSLLFICILANRMVFHRSLEEVFSISEESWSLSMYKMDA